MDKKIVEEYLLKAESSIAAARRELNAPDAPPKLEDCDELVRTLETGGIIELAKPISCSIDTYFSVKGGTRLYGAFSALNGGKYAIQVASGQNNGVIRELSLSAQGSDCVLNLGVNDETQNSLDQVPTGWLLDTININNYKGKRGIAINSMQTIIRNSVIIGIIHPNAQDSQAICVLNSPGGLTVDSCLLSAAAECVLVGGDSMKIPGTREDLIFTNCEMFKDMAWKTAGIPIKNIAELKDGWEVVFQNCKLYNCWVKGQAGEAFMFTPSNGGKVSVKVIDNEVYDVSSICNITGVDRSLINTVRTQVEFNGGTYKTNKTAMGGRGNFALLDRGPEFLKINNCDISIDGPTLIELVGTAKMDLLEITNSRFNYGTYGIRIGGLNDGDNSKGMIGTITIEGNTILGANSRFRARYPNNIYA